MNMKKGILALLFSVLWGHDACAMNYYELFGISRRASTDEIRKRCMGIESSKVVQKKQEIEAAKAEYQAFEDAPEAKEQRSAALEKKKRLEEELKKITLLSWMVPLRKEEITSQEITKACAILKDPSAKSAYDAGLPSEGAVEKKPYLEAIWRNRTYYQRFVPALPRDASPDEIRRVCTREKEKRTRAVQEALLKLPRDYMVQRRSSPAIEEQVRAFEIMQRELEMIEEACTTLLDPKKRKDYDEGKSDEFSKMGKSVTGLRADMDIILVDIVGDFLTQIPIPDLATKLFNQQLAMRNMSIVKAPTGLNVRTGIGFTGTMFFNKFAVKATMYVVRDYNRKLQYALSVELPEHYKLSSMFPNFKKLDQLSLPRGKLVVSTFDYYDPEGFSIKPGLNFNAFLELRGPLKLLNKLMDQSKKLKSVVARSEPIRFQGVIPRDIKKVSFRATIPIRLGVDFTKIAKMPKSVTDIFKEITTDDLELVLTAPPLLSFTVESGIRLVLTKQPDPIRLSAFGMIEPVSFSLGMRMRNMLELKWIALGNAGIQLDFDEALLPVAAVFGVPFTGIGLNGQIEVGRRGDKRVTFKVSGGVRVVSTGIPDLVLEVSALNLRFSDLIKLLIKVASRKGRAPVVDFSKIPVMHLEHIRGFMALKDTKIAGRIYDAGFALEADALLFNRRAGFSFDLKQTRLSCSGSGYMSNVDIKVKGKEIFKLTGPPFATKAGKMVEGPAIDFYFGFKRPDEGGARGQFLKALEGRFGVRGILEIPAIALKQSVDFEWSGWNLRGNFETIYAGFTIIFGIQIALKSGMESMSSYDLLRREVVALIDQKEQKDPNVIRAKELMVLAEKSFSAKIQDEARQQLEEARILLQEAKQKEFLVEDTGTVQGAISQIEVLIAEIDLLLNAAKGSSPVIKEARRMKDEASRTYRSLKGQMSKPVPGQEGKEKISDAEKRIFLMAQQLQGVRNELKKEVGEAAMGDFFKAKERTADPRKKWREMYIKFGFKGDFAKFLTEQAVPAIKRLQKIGSEKLGKLNEEIGHLSQKVKNLGSKGEAATETEIQKTRKRITDIQQKITVLKQQRSKAPKGKKMPFTLKIGAQKTALRFQQIYLEGMLKPGKQVIKGVSKAVASATSALQKAKILKTAVEKVLGGFAKALTGVAKGFSIFKIQEILGEYSAQDILDLKLPRLISLIAEINIPGLPQVSVTLRNLQFDFKRIGYSVSIMAQQLLLGGIKVSGKEGGGGLTSMLGGIA
jgi:hypothetical protein